MHQVDIPCDTCGSKHQYTVNDKQMNGEQPVQIECSLLDRRYKIAKSYCDFRRRIVGDDPAYGVASDLIKSLENDLGQSSFNEKLQRWKSVDFPSIMLIDESPEFIKQAVNSYCFGDYFPATTSSCCLGERILNRLLLKTRHYFKNHPTYRKIHNKDSCTDWSLMTNFLEDCSVINADTANHFRDLRNIRNFSVHYNEAYDFEAASKIAITKIITIVSNIFGIENRPDLYIVFDMPGELWVRSEFQKTPFFNEFVKSSCLLLHSRHHVDVLNNKIIEIGHQYGQLTDGEFILSRNMYVQSLNSKPLRDIVDAIATKIKTHNNSDCL